MGLGKIEIENFKSYAGTHTIGPFDKFTCIVGPNGSGKSNIMDAIAFAFGISSTSLRTSTAVNCIHNGSSDASVKIFIDQHTFRRHISSSGKSTYFHDGKVVSFEEYSKALGLDLKLRNFMVFQGDIHEIANKSPKELCEYFEYLSGSIVHKKEYDEVAQSLQKDLAECSALYEKKKNILSVMREEKEEKKQIESFKRNVENKTNLERNILNLEVRDLKNKFIEVSENLEHFILKQEKMNSEVETFEKEVLRKKEEVDKVRKEYSSLEQDLQDLKYKKMNQIREMAAIYKMKDRNNLLKKDDLEEELKSKKEDLRRLEEFKDNKQELVSISSRKEECEKKRREKVENRLMNLKRNIADLYSKMGDDLKKYEDLEKQEKEMNQKVYEIVSRLLKVRATRKINLKKETARGAVNTLKGIFPGVHGLLIDLVRPTQKKYYSSLLNIIQSHDYSVVIDSDTTALSCINYIKEKKLCKLTFLPLRTLKEKEIILHNEKDYRSALLCVSFEDRFTKAVQMVLKDSVIADSKDIALDLVYSRGFKCNVCSLDNFFIRSKGRIISSFRECVESEDLFSKLVEERKNLLKRIKDLQDEKSRMSRLEIVKERIKVYEDKIKEDEEFLKENDLKKESDLKKEGKRDPQKEYEALKKKVEEEIRNLEERINDEKMDDEKEKKMLEKTDERGFDALESEIRKYDLLTEKKRADLESLQGTLLGINEEYKALNSKRKEIDLEYLNLEALRNRLEEEIEEKKRFAMLEEITLDEENVSQSLDSLREELALVNKKINEMVPSIKTGRKDLNYNRVLQEYEDAKYKAMETRKRMNEIKRERKNLFMSCFEVVSSEIGKIYQEISNSEMSRGNAYLVLDNPTEPYLEGIRFHVMPPSKRFREIGLLSGGEKSMAILALMFSINRYRPVPFFILDEFDSALDKTNVGRMVDFFVRSEVQFLVISLKPILFQYADSLIGVYKEEKVSSRILSYRL